MSKTFLIIQREFTTRVKKKSFIIMTILSPFLMAALVFLPIWLATIEDDEVKNVAVYDSTSHYVDRFKNSATYHFERITNPNAPAYYSDTTRYEAVIAITGDLVRDPRQVTIFSNKEVPAGLLSYAENVINESVRQDKLAACGVEGLEDIIEDIQKTVTISTVKRNAEGESVSSSTSVAIACGFALTFLIYMFVMAYGGMVMSSVMEEKTNRIVELMVSSVKPFQLMMGKIIGISFVGFVQLFIWGVMLLAILWGAGAAFGLSGMPIEATVPGVDTTAMSSAIVTPSSETSEIYSALMNLPYGELGILFLLYFVGGYLLYASFFAAIGASVNEQEDSSQFMTPIILIFVFGMYAAMGSVENTNGPLAFWTSLFPLTSPIVMMVRIPFSVPLWQEILSLVLLYATAIFFVWAGARIYRVGILMYGKKPSLKEMVKWMRYK